MAQGWDIDAAADQITFQEAPPTGVNNIVVTEFAAGARGGTDVWAIGAWCPFYGYPGEVEFYADRLWFANTPLDPQTIWASCIGDYTNFGRSSPIVDSDSVSFVINARQVNTIKDLIPLDNLLIMTSGGEYKVTGGQDDVVSPSTIGVKNQGNSGSGDVQAKVIGESAIYLQAEGQKVRDLGYKFEKDGFRGNEISVWAEHFFEGYTINLIEYWKAPWQVLWFIRNDGDMIGCTYMPEQEVAGFHSHDTQGEYLDSCSLPGLQESECYYLVERVIDGETIQFIEQQAPTRAATESDMFFVDCGQTFDGRNGSSATLELSTVSGGWTEEDTLSIESSVGMFAGASDVGDGFTLFRDIESEDTNEDSDTYGEMVTTRISVRLIIDAYVDATHVEVRSIGTVPEELRTLAMTTWMLMRDTVGDLWHLEGKKVKVLQDAAVVGPYTVTDGQVVLDSPGGVVQIGLGYKAEAHTLELNNPGGESMRDKQKLAYEVSILLLASRGVRAGGFNEGRPTKTYPVKERHFENYGQPPFLKSGIVTVSIPAGWGTDAGRVRLISDDPLPMEILSITTKAAQS